MFARCNEHGRRALEAAQREAAMLGRNYIGTEHLLLGVLNDPGKAGVVLNGITLEEARTYYAAHENDFQLPEIFDACLVTGQTREAVEDFCRRFAAGDWLETADLLVQCRDMAVTDLPPDWRAPLTELKEGQCAAPRRGGGFGQGGKLPLGR